MGLVMGSLATGQGEPFKEICSFLSPLSTSQHGVLGLWSKPPPLSSPPKPGVGGGTFLSYSAEGGEYPPPAAYGLEEPLE